MIFWPMQESYRKPNVEESLLKAKLPKAKRALNGGVCIKS